jgi:uncharacterized RDD family membrane protein YckC
LILGEGSVQKQKVNKGNKNEGMSDFFQSSAASPEPKLVSAGPLRRLGAIVYDAMIVVALQVVATLPFLPLIQDRVLVAKEVGALAYVYHVWQVVVIVLFFGFFWTRNGKTLGMQAWRLHLQTEQGSLPTWRDAIMRLLLATLPWLPAFAILTAADYLEPREWLARIGVGVLGLGLRNYLIAWFDPELRSWHDRFLHTRVVRL